MKHTVALISANKQMLTGAGGGFESGQRLFIIEHRDCPSLVLHQTDWVGYNGRKYAIENSEEYEFDAAYLITGKELPAKSPAWPGRLSISRPPTRWPWTPQAGVGG